MQKIFAVALLLAGAVMVNLSWSAESKLESEADKALYSLGYQLSQRLGELKLSPEDSEIFLIGFREGLLGSEAQIPEAERMALIQSYSQQRAAEESQEEKESGAAFLAKAAEESGAVTTESGVVFIELEAGSGDSPTIDDEVEVHYRGSLRDGTIFDSSYDRNETASFPLGSVVKCWQEGVQLMKPGGKARIICPSDLAYGDMGRPPTIPGGAVLDFEIELISIKE